MALLLLIIVYNFKHLQIKRHLKTVFISNSRSCSPVQVSLSKDWLSTYCMRDIWTLNAKTNTQNHSAKWRQVRFSFQAYTFLFTICVKCILMGKQMFISDLGLHFFINIAIQSRASCFPLSPSPDIMLSFTNRLLKHPVTLSKWKD